jgi:UDP-N-acetylmuramoyl-tripeptide--D-alanyl-D-alanine ligase
MLKLSEIRTITQAEGLSPEPEITVGGIATDSRNLKAGDLFIALRGEKYDGGDFLEEAFARGAAAALVSRTPAPPKKGPVLVVNDTLAALGALAANWRRRFDLPVVAVTGSVGKTTTKEMLAAILSQSREVLKTPENYNNEIGVPLTLLQLKQAHQVGVIEIAMRGKGQIRYLAEMCAPTVGVITNIGVSHLELLSSPAAIAQAKAELLEVMGSTGKIVLNQDSESFPFLAEKAGQLLTFGLRSGQVRAEAIKFDGQGSSFTLWLPREASRPEGESESVPVTLPVPGKHNIANALAAAAAARWLGISAQQIGTGLEAFRAVIGRMRLLQSPLGYTIIDDSYNASPDSMRAALEVLADIGGERKIAVLGDMRELGPESAMYHRAIGRFAGQLPLDLIVTVGEMGQEIANSAADALSSAAIEFVPSAQDALRLLAGLLRPGDVVLVKASRALGLETVVKGLLDIKS